jgi:hypothetical protein
LLSCRGLELELLVMVLVLVLVLVLEPRMTRMRMMMTCKLSTDRSCVTYPYVRRQM